jgi:hypothetical protein
MNIYMYIYINEYTYSSHRYIIVRQAVIDRLQEMENASSKSTSRSTICIADHIVSEQIREPEVIEIIHLYIY